MAEQGQSRTRRAALSSGALILAAALALGAIALGEILFSGWRLDLTENRQYTLAQGTRDVLAGLDEPIDLVFFYSAEQAQGLPQITNYASRITELLKEFEARAEGRLRLEIVDPEPFSENEDRAVSLGIEAVPINNQGDNLYFGLAASNSVDETETIPFFQPDREEMLEYDLAKMVYQLNQASKPVIGLISTLEAMGEVNPMQRRRTESWLVISQLQEFFEVRDLPTTTAQIPEDVDVLMLIHPAMLNDQTRYAIDQFALRGGRVLMFIDPYATLAVPTGDPMMDSGLPTISNPTDLIAAWGAEMIERRVLGDFEHALQVQVQPGKPPVHHVAMIGLDETSMNKDDVVTRELQSVNLAFTGALRPREDATTTFTPLLQSSQRAALIEDHRIQPRMDPAVLLVGFEPSGERYPIAARLQGPAKSAFPAGPPEVKDGEEKAVTAGPHLAESEADINVILVADADLLLDRMWAQSRDIGGQRFITPWAGNADFVVGAVDNLLGSDALINIRPRASFARPFEVVDELRRKADTRFRAKQEELQQQLRNAESQLSNIFTQQEEGGDTAIVDQQLKETLNNLQEERLRIRKELRQVLHSRDAEIDALGAKIKFLNIFLVPALLCLLALLIAVLRRRNARSGASA